MLFFSATDLPVLPQAPALGHAGKLGSWAARRVVGFAKRMTKRLVRARVPATRRARSAARRAIRCSRACSRRSSRSRSSRACSASRSPIGRRTCARPASCSTTARTPLFRRSSKHFLAAGPPPVVFTLGTSAVGAAGRFYHESAAAAARLGVRAVLLIGSFEQNRPDGEPSRDVLVVDRAPHQLLFPRASAIVHSRRSRHHGTGAAQRPAGARRAARARSVR